MIVIVSNTWAFLDPTLEPHLRQFNLSTQEIGLIFLLFSSLYGIFSPIWGWVADRYATTNILTVTQSWELTHLSIVQRNPSRWRPMFQDVERNRRTYRDRSK